VNKILQRKKFLDSLISYFTIKKIRLESVQLKFFMIFAQLCKMMIKNTL